MDDCFKIYIEQLRDGQSEKICETFSAELLDVDEVELTFDTEVKVEGEAYLTEEMLLLHLTIHTSFLMPCAICNANVRRKIEIKGLYHPQPLAEIKSSVFNFKSLLRELILLEVPQFAECEGKCPKREEIAHYFKVKQEMGTAELEDDGYQPFANLNWDSSKKIHKI